MIESRINTCCPAFLLEIVVIRIKSTGYWKLLLAIDNGFDAYLLCSFSYLSTTPISSMDKCLFCKMILYYYLQKGIVFNSI